MSSPRYGAAVTVATVASILLGLLAGLAAEPLPWQSEYAIGLGVTYLAWKVFYPMATANWMAYKERTLSSVQSEREAEIITRFEAAIRVIEALIERFEKAMEDDEAEDDDV